VTDLLRVSYPRPSQKILALGKSHWNREDYNQHARHAFQRASLCKTPALGSRAYVSANDCSAKTLVLAEELSERLRAWKQATDFSDASDWIFASPVKLGRLPYSYTGVRRLMARSAEAAEIGHLTTHAFRHTYRTWLNATGTPIGTQQKLMRHSTITMTMDTYGTVFDEEMSAASGRVARLAFQGDRAQNRAHSR